MARPKPAVQFDRIAAEIGGANALRLCAVVGHKRNVYVPKAVSPDHLFAHVLEPAGFELLVQAYGGTYLAVPDVIKSMQPLRNAGVALDMHEAGVAKRVIAALLDLSESTIFAAVSALKGIEPASALDFDDDDAANDLGARHAA